MRRLIKTFVTSITYIFLGIATGWALDFWQQYTDTGGYKSSYEKRVAREYKYMDDQWKLMKKAGLLYGYINKRGYSICELDFSDECGSCVSG
jgi:hypothetical protein